MLITIDGSSFLTRRVSAIAKCTKNLITELLKLDKENKYIIFFYTSTRERHKLFLQKEKLFKSENVSFKTLNIPQYGFEILWNKIGLRYPPIELFIGKTDIFHSPGYRVPLTKKAKLITTIHDLTRLKIRENLPKNIVEHFLSIVQPAIERSDKIIAISENTKKDIIEIFNIPQEKVRVIYYGISKNFCPIDDKEKIKEILKKYNISQPYLLCVATSLGKNKNLSTLIKSFKFFKDKYKSEHKLVIVGKKSEEYNVLFRLACELKIDNGVIFTDYVPEDDLVYFYNGAEVFVFLSLYEGFGLPVLEAMSCGLPVIVANTSSLPEVVGDAGILVSPYDIEQIAELIYKIISDSEFKESLVNKSLSQAKKFSWEKCAQETLRLYYNVCLGEI